MFVLKTQDLSILDGEMINGMPRITITDPEGIASLYLTEMQYLDLIRELLDLQFLTKAEKHQFLQQYIALDKARNNVQCNKILRY
jgi:hypothetical protein